MSHLFMLVHEDDEGRDVDLAGEKDVLAGLGHRAVGGGDNKNSSVHLGGAGDHVLDVVGVAGAVDVSIVAGGRLVLDVGDVDGDAALSLFRRLVDHIERREVGLAVTGERLRDGGRQRRLAMVDVAYRTYVKMRLVTYKMFFCHLGLTSSDNT